MKIYNIKFLVFLFLVVAFSVGYPILNHKYIKPKKFKEELFELLKTSNPFNSSDDQIANFTECLTDQLLKTYKTVENIPEWKDYGLKERKLAMDCIMDNLIKDPSDKQIFKANYDSIIVKIWK